MFLFLQGPHGPFFFQLGRSLRRAGATVWRVGFNAGDRAFWPHLTSYLPWRGSAGDWPAEIDRLISSLGVTDLVLYGDTRPVHALAVKAAKAAGLQIHVFEEGYLRPWWVTYETNGSNGNSRLMQISINEIVALRARRTAPRPVPPAHWGQMRQHIFYGALYHWFVMFLNQRYREFRPHRTLTVRQEFSLYLRRLVLMPLRSLERYIAALRIRRGGYPYHLCLLQLEHDSSFQMHSSFERQSDYLELVIAGFAGGAPSHHHLVFKAHPLEDGRAPLRRDIRRFANEYGVGDRVHYVAGGKLAALLNDARSALTVNSTSGQQALWRGIPLHVTGDAVYDKPELVSRQPVAAFFATPMQPDKAAYREFREFLLETSQVPGSFYSSAGRRQVRRHVVDQMLLGADPYQRRTLATAAQEQQLRLVK